MELKRVDEIYTQLNNLVYTLPNFITPDEISSAIVSCRQKINKIEEVAIEVAREFSKVRREFSAKKKERQIRFVSLMRENEEVKKGKSGLDRQAIAESLLGDLDTQISDLESKFADLKYLNDSIQLRISNLNKTNSDIRLAWVIMQNTTHLTELPKSDHSVRLTPEDLKGLDFAEQILHEEIASEVKALAVLGKVDPKELEKEEKKVSSKDLGKEDDEEGFDFLGKEEVGSPIDLSIVPKEEKKLVLPLIEELKPQEELKIESKPKEEPKPKEELKPKEESKPKEEKPSKSKAQGKKKPPEPLPSEDTFTSSVTNLPESDIESFLSDLG